MDFSIYKLKDNPFRIGPAIRQEELIWVGMKEIKKKIHQRLEMGIKTSPSKLILNWGRYGSGKTHAANYFTKTDYIERHLNNASAKKIKINLPRSTKEPVQAFLRALLGQLDFNILVQDFVKLKETYGERMDNIVDVHTQDSIIAEAIKLLYSDNKGNTNTLFDVPLAKDLVKNYFFGDNSKDTLKHIGIPLGLKDDEQIVNLISGILNCLTFEKSAYQAAFIWIDEFEDIDTLPKSSQDRFTTFLRQLIDKTPNNLSIFLNFTLKPFAELENLALYLGEALATRTKIYIEFDSPSNDQAKEYLIELLNHSLFKKEEDADSSLYPFTESAVSDVLSKIGNLSIRKINETFSLIMELALINDPIPDEINLDFIHTIKEELVYYN